MHLRLMKIYFALIVYIVLVECEPTVENGRYVNVVVSFEENVPSEKGSELLDNFKTVLNSTSEILQSAIGISFSKVTVIIPKSWDFETELPLISRFKPDIMVDGVNNTVFGKFPYAHQYGPCGIPGSQLTIPTAFLAETLDFPKGTILAREWIKFRYGVFDENGFRNDELYPLFYNIPGSDPGEARVTDCTNTPLTYNFIDKEGNNCSKFDEKTGFPDANECMPTPADENLETISSSLLYFQEQLHSMRTICGIDEEHKHNSRSPSKQNALCHGKSIWDVIRNSSDLQNVQEPAEINEIEYEFVRRAYPRTVIMWENTEKMNPKGKMMLDAIRRFMYELPDGSKYALIPFTDDAEGDTELHELSDWPSGREVKYSSNFGVNEDGCVVCAILKATQILSNDTNQSDGTVVVIVHSNLASKERLQDIQNLELCWIFIVFNSEVLQEYTDFANSLPCGKVEDFSNLEEDIEIFKNVYDSMMAILPESINGRTTETKNLEYVTPVASITVPVDSTVEKIMFWILLDLEKKATELTFKGQKIDAVEEFRVSGMYMALSYAPQQAGNQIGDLKITFNYPKDKQFLTHVTTISKEGKYFSGDIFIHDTTEKDSETQMPVIIYASIRLDDYPVQNADVEVIIKRPDGNRVVLPMYDDGKGDPDITRNDGVYSRYFFRFTGAGDYAVEVMAKTLESTKGGRVYYHENEGFQTCCGSSLDAGELPLLRFSKNFTGSFTAKSGRPKEGYKPSRIADLKIGGVDGDKIILQWTAPGAEADEGTASRYKINIFCEEEENTTDCNVHKLVRILNKPPPMNYGKKQTVTIQIIEKSKPFSVGITSINGRNQESDLSNIISLVVSSNTNSNRTTISPDPPGLSPTSVGAIVGYSLIGILLLICAIPPIICFLKSRRKKLQDNDMENYKSMNNDKQTNSITSTNGTSPNPSTNGMRREDSFPVLLYTHDQIKDFKDKSDDPPLYKNDVLPQSWVSLDVFPSSKSRERCDSDAKSSSTSSTIHDDSQNSAETRY